MMNSESNENKGHPRLIWIVVIAFILVISYQVYSGVHLKKIGIPSIFEVEFSSKDTTNTYKETKRNMDELNENKTTIATLDAPPENSVSIKIMLPTAIAEKQKLVEQERIDYPNRQRDLEYVQRYIANGQFDLAELELESIMQQQRNLRGN